MVRVKGHILSILLLCILLCGCCSCWLFLLQGYWRNLTGSKYQMSPVKFGSCGQISSLLFKFCVKEVEAVHDNSNKHALFLFQIYWLPPTIERFLMVPDAHAWRLYHKIQLISVQSLNTNSNCVMLKFAYLLSRFWITGFTLAVHNIRSE